jgi:hypothetical protein
LWHRVAQIKAHPLIQAVRDCLLHVGEIAGIIAGIALLVAIVALFAIEHNPE